MANCTVDQIRVLTGLTVSQLADATIESLITLADTQIDDEVEVEMSSSHKEQASIYLTSAMALERLATGALGSAGGGGFALDRFRVDEKSTQQLRMSVADNFRNRYNEILATATSAINVVKKIEG